MDEKNLFHDLNAHCRRNVWLTDKSGLFLVITEDETSAISVNGYQDTVLRVCDAQELFVPGRGQDRGYR